MKPPGPGAPDEVRRVVLLSLPTIGPPPMMAARTWGQELLKCGDKRK